MKVYEFYDWDKEFQDWVWVGSDNGTVRMYRNQQYFHTHHFDFMNAKVPIDNSKLDEEHFVDEKDIIDTEWLIYRGEKIYMSVDEIEELKDKYAMQGRYTNKKVIKL